MREKERKCKETQSAFIKQQKIQIGLLMCAYVLTLVVIVLSIVIAVKDSRLNFLEIVLDDDIKYQMPEKVRANELCLDAHFNNTSLKNFTFIHLLQECNILCLK